MINKDLENYMAYMMEDKKENKMRDKIAELGIKLAKTNPILSFNKSAWKSNRTFQENDSNKAWVAAYTLFGASWFTGSETWAKLWEEKETQEGERNHQTDQTVESDKEEEERKKPPNLPKGILRKKKKKNKQK